MNKTKKTTKLILAILFITLSYSQEQNQNIVVTDLQSLPAENNIAKSYGYAGMLGGQQGEVTIAAGGANFPDGLPWKGGKKVWSDNIFILELVEFLKTIYGAHLKQNYRYHLLILPQLP